MSETPKKRWYVVQAFSGFEGRVAQSFREHIKLHDMEELFGEVMVPTEEVIEIRGGQRRGRCALSPPHNHPFRTERRLSGIVLLYHRLGQEA